MYHFTSTQTFPATVDTGVVLTHFTGGEAEAEKVKVLLDKAELNLHLGHSDLCACMSPKAGCSVHPADKAGASMTGFQGPIERDSLKIRLCGGRATGLCRDINKGPLQLMHI